MAPTTSAGCSRLRAQSSTSACASKQSANSGGWRAKADQIQPIVFLGAIRGGRTSAPKQTSVSTPVAQKKNQIIHAPAIADSPEQGDSESPAAPGVSPAGAQPLTNLVCAVLASSAARSPSRRLPAKGAQTGLVQASLSSPASPASASALMRASSIPRAGIRVRDTLRKNNTNGENGSQIRSIKDKRRTLNTLLARGTAHQACESHCSAGCQPVHGAQPLIDLVRAVLGQQRRQVLPVGLVVDQFAPMPAQGRPRRLVQDQALHQRARRVLGRDCLPRLVSSSGPLGPPLLNAHLLQASSDRTCYKTRSTRSSTQGRDVPQRLSPPTGGFSFISEAEGADASPRRRITAPAADPANHREEGRQKKQKMFRGFLVRKICNETNQKKEHLDQAEHDSGENAKQRRLKPLNAKDYKTEQGGTPRLGQAYREPAPISEQKTPTAHLLCL